MHPDFSAAKIEKKKKKLREQIWYIELFLITLQKTYAEHTS
jgi:hypothetical protein